MTKSGRLVAAFEALVGRSAALVAVAAASLVMLGCSGKSGEWDNDPNALALGSSSSTTLDHYRLTISPDFPSDRLGEIFAASSTWTQAVPVTFDIQVAECTPDTLEPNEVCIRPTTAEDQPPEIFGWTTPYEENAWDVAIYTVHLANMDPADMPPWATAAPDPNGALFQEIVAHEIGHALGLSHRSDFELMNHYVNDAAPGPTQGDIAQWFSLRSPPPQ